MKKLLLLAAVTVMALAALGVGYAMWSDTLTIKGTVSTGTLDVELSGPYIEERGDGELAKPEVANCYAVDTGDPDLIAVRVENAYPSYMCAVEFDVHGVGTVPAHVHQPVPASGNPAYVTIADGCFATVIKSDGTVEQVVDEPQLHTSDRTYCTIIIHFTNDTAPSDGSASVTETFSFGVYAHQFNEEP